MLGGSSARGAASAKDTPSISHQIKRYFEHLALGLENYSPVPSQNSEANFRHAHKMEDRSRRAVQGEAVFGLYMSPRI